LDVDANGAEATLELARAGRALVRGGAEPCRVSVRDAAGYWHAGPTKIGAGELLELELVPGPYDLVVERAGSERVLALPVAPAGVEPSEVLLP
jgi:hypothetical protein